MRTRRRCATPRARSGPNTSRWSARRSPGATPALLRALVGDLHESDAGDLIEALDPELRPQLIELMGKDFDFTALTEVDDAVREEILEELQPRDRRGGRARPRFRRCRLHSGRPAEGRAGRNPRTAAAARTRRASRRASTTRKSSAGRRMQTEFIAVPPIWTVGQTIDYMRETEDLPERFFEIYVVGPAASSSARCRSTGCCAPSGRCRCPT